MAHEDESLQYCSFLTQTAFINDRARLCVMARRALQYGIKRLAQGSSPGPLGVPRSRDSAESFATRRFAMHPI